MDYFVIRNKRQLADLFEQLNNRRLPCKIVVDDIYPTRSVDMNAYAWGVVYEFISKATGHTIIEVHEGYKKLMNFRCDFKYDPETKSYRFISGVASTANLSSKDYWDYLQRVRAHAEIELNIIIPLPSEAWIDELNFDYENTHQTKRI